MSRPQHSTGKRERPSYAGVVAFVLLCTLPLDFIVPFIFNSKIWQIVSIVVILCSLGWLCWCVLKLEETDGKHKAADDWTADDWRLER